MSTTERTPTAQNSVPDSSVTPTANEIINLAQSEIANYKIALENALHEAAIAKDELKNTLEKLKEKYVEPPTVQYVEKIKYVEAPPQRSFLSRLLPPNIPTNNTQLQSSSEPELGTPISEMFPLFCIPNPLKR